MINIYIYIYIYDISNHAKTCIRPILSQSPRSRCEEVWGRHGRAAPRGPAARFEQLIKVRDDFFRRDGRVMPSMVMMRIFNFH